MFSLFPRAIDVTCSRQVHTLVARSVSKAIPTTRPYELKFKQLTVSGCPVAELQSLIPSVSEIIKLSFNVNFTISDLKIFDYLFFCYLHFLDDTQPAEKNPFVVGCLTIRQNYIWNFGVHPHFRERKIGTKLLNNVLIHLNSQQRPCYLYVLQENTLAASFYLKNGFEYVKTHKNDYVDNPSSVHSERLMVRYPMALKSGL